MANIAWMRKQIPWPMALALDACSRAARPVLLPEKPRKGMGTRRFHPETWSSQPKIPTPAMRWRVRSPAGMRNNWGGTRRIMAAGTAATRLHVPQRSITAYHGLPGPETNQNTVRYVAWNSKASRYQAL